MKEDYKISFLSCESIEEAADVFLLAFQREAFMSSWIDLTNPKHRRVYSKIVKLLFRIYIESGHTVYSINRNGNVKGLLIIQSPYVKISKINAAIRVIPDVHNVLRLLPLFGRAIRLTDASKLPSGLPKGFFELHIIAVHPTEQGKGFGSKLLEITENHCFEFQSSSGIYLKTGDESNKAIYKKSGYRLIEERQTGDFVSYHMFKDNPNFLN